MKKIFVLLIVIFTAFPIVSCNNSNKEAKKHEGHHHEDKKAHPMEYACPKGCQDGKIYAEEGKCTVCATELIELEHQVNDGHEAAEGKGKNDLHNHSHLNDDHGY